MRGGWGRAPGACDAQHGARTHSAVVADELFALVAGVGEVGVVAGDAVRAVVHLDVLAPVQGLLAVVAVEALGHGAGLGASFTCWEKEQRRSLSTASPCRDKP